MFVHEAFEQRVEVVLSNVGDTFFQTTSNCHRRLFVIPVESLDGNFMYRNIISQIHFRYRVTLMVEHLVWVDFDLGCSTILLGQ